MIFKSERAAARPSLFIPSFPNLIGSFSGKFRFISSTRMFVRLLWNNRIIPLSASNFHDFYANALNEIVGSSLPIFLTDD